jgi:hypothetical protein
LGLESITINAVRRNPVGVGIDHDCCPKVAEYSNLGLHDTTPLGLRSIAREVPR